MISLTKYETGNVDFFIKKGNKLIPFNSWLNKEIDGTVEIKNVNSLSAPKLTDRYKILFHCGSPFTANPGTPNETECSPNDIVIKPIRLNTLGVIRDIFIWYAIAIVIFYADKQLHWFNYSFQWWMQSACIVSMFVICVLFLAFYGLRHLSGLCDQWNNEFIPEDEL